MTGPNGTAPDDTEAQLQALLSRTVSELEARQAQLKAELADVNGRLARYQKLAAVGEAPAPAARSKTKADAAGSVSDEMVGRILSVMRELDRPAAAREVSEQAGVAIGTVRKAIERLRADGTVRDAGRVNRRDGSAVGLRPRAYALFPEAG